MHSPKSQDTTGRPSLLPNPPSFDETHSGGWNVDLFPPGELSGENGAERTKLKGSLLLGFSRNMLSSFTGNFCMISDECIGGPGKSSLTREPTRTSEPQRNIFQNTLSNIVGPLDLDQDFKRSSQDTRPHATAIAMVCKQLLSTGLAITGNIG